MSNKGSVGKDNSGVDLQRISETENLRSSVVGNTGAKKGDLSGRGWRKARERLLHNKRNAVNRSDTVTDLSDRLSKYDDFSINEPNKAKDVTQKVKRSSRRQASDKSLDFSADDSGTTTPAPEILGSAGSKVCAHQNS